MKTFLIASNEVYAILNKSEIYEHETSEINGKVFKNRINATLHKKTFKIKDFNTFIVAFEQLFPKSKYVHNNTIRYRNFTSKPSIFPIVDSIRVDDAN